MAECSYVPFRDQFISILAQASTHFYSRLQLSDERSIDLWVNNQKIASIAEATLPTPRDPTSIQQREVCCLTEALQDLYDYLQFGALSIREPGIFLSHLVCHESLKIRKRILSYIKQILPCHRLAMMLFSLPLEEAVNAFFAYMQQNKNVYIQNEAVNTDTLLCTLYSHLKCLHSLDQPALNSLNDPQKVLSLIQSQACCVPEVKKLRSIILCCQPSFLQTITNAIEEWVGQKETIRWTHTPETSFWVNRKSILIKLSSTSSWNKKIEIDSERTKAVSWSVTCSINFDGELGHMSLSAQDEPIKLPPESAVNGTELHALLTGSKKFYLAETASLAFRHPDMDSIVPSFLKKKDSCQWWLQTTCKQPNEFIPNITIFDLLSHFGVKSITPSTPESEKALMQWIKGNDPLTARIRGILVAASEEYMRLSNSFMKPACAQIVIVPRDASDHVFCYIQGVDRKGKIGSIEGQIHTTLDGQGNPIRICISQAKGTHLLTADTAWTSSILQKPFSECLLKKMIWQSPLNWQQLLAMGADPQQHAPNIDLEALFQSSPAVAPSIRRYSRLVQRAEFWTPMTHYLAHTYGGTWTHEILKNCIGVEERDPSLCLKLASTVTDDHKDHFERQMEQKVKPLNWDVELTFQDYGIICSAKGSPLFSEPHFRLPQKTIFPNSFNSSWQCPPARLISADFFNPMNVAKDFERFAENIKLVGHSEISEPGSSSFHVLCDMIGDLDHNARSQMINNVLEWHSTSTHPRKKFFFNLATAGAQYLTATPVKAVTICRSELPSLEDEGPLRHSNLPVCVELHNNGTYTITQKNISTRTMFIDGDRRDTSEHITWERMFTFKDDALWLVDMSLKAVQWEGIDQEKVEKMKASLSGSWVCLNGDTLAKTIMPVLRPDLGNTGIYIDLLNETVDNQNDISPIIQKLIPFVSDRSYLQNLVNTALTHVSEPHLQPFIYSSISQDPNGFSIRHEVAIEQADRPFAEIPTFSYATKAIFYMILSFDQLGNYSNTTLFPHPIYKNPLPDNLQPYIDEIQRFYRSLAIEEK